VTTLLAGKVSVHCEPQMIIQSDEVTRPSADGVTVIDGGPLGGGVGLLEKLPVTFTGPFIVTVQSPAPLQAPLHPVNEPPAGGVAVSVTPVPVAKTALHAVPQLMPAGTLAMVPAPTRLIASVCVGEMLTANVAVTAVAPLTATLHVGVLPEHAPDQPVKLEPASGVAVSVTDVFVA
jgi:hypothetical protein